MVRENCGVVGVFSLDQHNIIPILIDSLRALQHRGQESWGIAVPNKKPFKQLGLVSSYADSFKHY
jgi:amidophosphoribosyltransferase